MALISFGRRRSRASLRLRIWISRFLCFTYNGLTILLNVSCKSIDGSNACILDKVFLFKDGIAPPLFKVVKSSVFNKQ